MIDQTGLENVSLKDLFSNNPNLRESISSMEKRFTKAVGEKRKLTIYYLAQTSARHLREGVGFSDNQISLCARAMNKLGLTFGKSKITNRDGWNSQSDELLEKQIASLLPNKESSGKPTPNQNGKTHRGISSRDKEPRLANLPIDSIEPYDKQPRYYFDQEKIAGLVQSLQVVGQSQPIQVTPKKGSNGKFVIIDGERRWRSAKKAGHTEISAIIVHVENEEEHFSRSFTANLCRENHTPMEIAKAIKKLVAFGYKHKAIGQLIGRSEAWVYQHLNLLELDPDIQRRLEPGVSKEERLSATAAVELARLRKPEQMKALKQATVQKGRAPTLTSIRRVVERKVSGGQGRSERNMFRPRIERSPADWRNNLEAFFGRNDDFLSHWAEKDSSDLRSIFIGVARADFNKAKQHLDEILKSLTTLRKEFDRVRF